MRVYQVAAALNLIEAELERKRAVRALSFFRNRGRGSAIYWIPEANDIEETPTGLREAFVEFFNPEAFLDYPKGFWAYMAIQNAARRVDFSPVLEA